MGIKPSGDNPVRVPPDNPQNRWGEYEAGLQEAGDEAGGVLNETWSLADAASQLAQAAWNGIETIGKILGGALDLGVGIFMHVANGVRSLIDGVTNAIRGLLPAGSPWSPIQDAFEDYQLGLKDRTDLIPLGYCAAYSDRNIPLAALVGSATRIVPFNAQLGPHQGAHVGNERIVFDLTGTWTVHVMVGFRGTPPLANGDGRVHIEVRVRRPNGSLASWWKVRGSPGDEEVSLTCSRPVVISEPGMYVEVMARSGMPRHVDGGTAHSVLTVVRSSLDTDNPGVPEVPDE